MNLVVTLGNVLSCVIFSLLVYYTSVKMLGRRSMPWIITPIVLFLLSLGAASRQLFSYGGPISSRHVTTYSVSMLAILVGAYGFYRSVLKGYVGTKK